MGNFSLIEMSNLSPHDEPKQELHFSQFDSTRNTFNWKYLFHWMEFYGKSFIFGLASLPNKYNL